MIKSCARDLQRPAVAVKYDHSGTRLRDAANAGESQASAPTDALNLLTPRPGRGKTQFIIITAGEERQAHGGTIKVTPQYDRSR